MEISVKVNYLIIGAIALAVSLVGQFFASTGMAWYYTLHLPSFTPPMWVFSVVWTLIFALTTTAAVLVWNRLERDRHFWLIIALFLLNALCNLMWSYLFFVRHELGLAFVDALFVFLTAFALLVLASQRSLFIAALLLIYPAWSLFALALNGAIALMN